MNKKPEPNKKNRKRPTRFGLLNSISMGLLILFLITGLYSVIAEQSTATEQIPLSELAHDVGMGTVMTVTVQGENIVDEYVE